MVAQPFQPYDGIPPITDSTEKMAKDAPKALKVLQDLGQDDLVEMLGLTDYLDSE